MGKQREATSWKQIRHKMKGILGEDLWKKVDQALSKQRPAIDMYQTDGEGVIVVELPGLRSPDDVQITLDSQKIILEGEVPDGSPVPQKQMLSRERWIGRFKRTIRNPFPFAPDSITAHYRYGLLEIRLTGQETKQQVSVQFDRKSP